MKKGKLLVILLFAAAFTLNAAASGDPAYNPATEPRPEGAGVFDYVPRDGVQHPETAAEFNNIPTFTSLPSIIGEKVYKGINVATGASVTKDALLKEENSVDITAYGAVAGYDADAVKNTEAINKAIEDMSAAGGGTVIVPDGIYKMYTIVLQSNVNIYLSDEAIIVGARPGIDGGNYLEPEVNIYFGLQDHGHSYLRNSMVYGKEVENVMIYGDGMISGSYVDKRGYSYFTVSRRDPANPELRTEPGYVGNWYNPDDIDSLDDQGWHFFLYEQPIWNNASKGIALLDSKNIVFSGFDMREAGHFAIITTGCSNVLFENMVIDTNRDGMDIDGTSNVTVRNCWVNAPLDDAICLKASFGSGRLDITQNILIHNCVISGYDAGSVLEATFSENRLESAADDIRGTNGRLKLGTEATGGFDRVTIANVLFSHSEGLNLECVDCSSLTNIIATDLFMTDVVDSPVYIQIGDRGRYPVTGHSTSEEVYPENSVRKDNSEYVLPNIPGKYHTFPAMRYAPATNYEYVTIADGSEFKRPVASDPIYINWTNIYTDPDTGKNYGYKWDASRNEYVVDWGNQLTDQELYGYGNALGGGFAVVEDIYIGNLKAVDVNPRYPIEVAGLVSSKVQNVTFENIDVTYRGGLTLEDAAEQRQIRSTWNFTEDHSPVYSQQFGWLAAQAGLLPRMQWDAENGGWIESPYNVPELVRDYPEPAHYGILPAYGLYARHVDGLTLKNVKLGYSYTETRPAVVLDDVSDVTIDAESEFMSDESVTDVVLVEQNFKRRTGYEFVPNEPYISTAVTDYEIADNHSISSVTVNVPEPGTPADTLYSYPTDPIADEAFVASFLEEGRDIPRTVWRPFFAPIKDVKASAGDTVEIEIGYYNPADATGTVYPVELIALSLPEGASFADGVYTWNIPADAEAGDYPAVFHLSDGMSEISKTVVVTIQ